MRENCNNVFAEDCLETMGRMEDESVDLVVTSPPYEDLRKYKGFNFDFQSVAIELYRVIKSGRIVVWVVYDATKKFNESGSSFKQALFFKEIGFNLLDTMIYLKQNVVPSDPDQLRYWSGFEYMFVFSKGKPIVCNYIKEECKYAGRKSICYRRDTNDNIRLDSVERNKNHVVYDTKVKSNVWSYSSADHFSCGKHPAPFPLQLAVDHIISWSNVDDLVYDPFIGSGTTAIACMTTGRNFCGSDISEEYVDFTKKRVYDFYMKHKLNPDFERYKNNVYNKTNK